MGFTTYKLEKGWFNKKAGNDEIIPTLVNYFITEGGASICCIKAYLTDPFANCSDYFCGNDYWQRLDNVNFFIAMEPDPEANADDDWPVVVNRNALYGLLLVWHTLCENNSTWFTITRDEQRYTVEIEGEDPIIIDPDLGWLYNDTIPKIIIRRTGMHVEYETRDFESEVLRENPLLYTDWYLVMLYECILKYYDPALLAMLQRWSDHGISREKFEHRLYTISHSYNMVKIHLCAPYSDRIEFFSLNRLTLVKLLQAWESYLHKATACTIVLLGWSLGFFEGEPLDDDKSQ